jgi:cell division protein FtsB
MRRNLTEPRQFKKKAELGEKKKIKYSLLTFVLLICIIELTVSAINNINKNISFVSKIKGLENKRNEELNKNKQLKSDIENFNSEATLEAMARNNLKMAGKNEVLIIVNEPKEDPAEENEKDKKNKKDKKE